MYTSCCPDLLEPEELLDVLRILARTRSELADRSRVRRVRPYTKTTQVSIGFNMRVRGFWISGGSGFCNLSSLGCVVLDKARSQ